MLDEAEIQTYLRSNERPSHSLVADIQQRLSGPYARIANLQTEMARLRAQLKDAQKRRVAVEESMNPYKKVLAKIRLIPDEVLRRIFIFCVSFSAPYPSVDEPDRPPVLLTHICRRWRDLAILTPELWTHIHVVLPPIHPFVDDDDKSVKAAIIRRNAVACLPEAVGRANLIIPWLDHSGDLPLTISLRLSADQYLASDYHPIVVDAMSVLLITVGMYIHRCRDLDIAITGRQLACLDATLSPEKVANIESLDIHIIDNSGMPEARIELFRSPLFSDLPSLRRLSLGSVYEGDPMPYQSSGVWQNITHLTMQEQTDLLRAAQVLELCPMLISCKMFIMSTMTSFAHPPPSNTYIFPQLQFLNLTFSAYCREDDTITWVPPILDIFAPRLEQLCYCDQTSPFWYRYDSDLTARPVPLSDCVPLSNILFAPTNLSLCEIEVYEDTVHNFAQALRLHGSKILHLKIGRHDHPTHGGPNFVTNADIAFRTLLPIPVWCAQALDVPLVQIPDISEEEVQKALNDCICPKLQELEITGLVDVSDLDLLSFILYRLRICEYAKARSEAQDRQFEGFAALRRVRILFCRSMDMEVVTKARCLALDIGMDVEIELEYDGGIYNMPPLPHGARQLD